MVSKQLLGGPNVGKRVDVEDALDGGVAKIHKRLAVSDSGIVDTNGDLELLLGQEPYQLVQVCLQFRLVANIALDIGDTWNWNRWLAYVQNVYMLNSGLYELLYDCPAQSARSSGHKGHVGLGELSSTLEKLELSGKQKAQSEYSGLADGWCGSLLCLNTYKTHGNHGIGSVNRNFSSQQN